MSVRPSAPPPARPSVCGFVDNVITYLSGLPGQKCSEDEKEALVAVQGAQPIRQGAARAELYVRLDYPVGYLWIGLKEVVNIHNMKIDMPNNIHMVFITKAKGYKLARSK